ncbi:uncharacterized protein LOC124159672 [Ischnura elegans]|uniref:uncharacterized protein LOC124159672 n=1 Tax=Ischnura elegans TaxID=197161 RepID=UPI001ED88137|nr:uncharacterized protein LOC124159672 [Ischnura elegans]
MFTGRKGSAAAAYGKICTEIGIPNVAAAKKKWENLVDKYKKCKYPKTGMGTEGGDKGPLTWKFYEAMDEVLGRKHIISPPLIVDSGVQGSTSCPTVTPPQPTPTPSEVDDVQELMCTASTPTWRERAVRKRKRSEEDDPLHQLLG